MTFYMWSHHLMLKRIRLIIDIFMLQNEQLSVYIWHIAWHLSVR